MDLVADCKLKLAKFRVKELKDVLSLLGLENHGLKRELVARISDLLTFEQDSSTSASTSASTDVFEKEEVAKIIDDVHRKMLAEMYELALDKETSHDTNSIVQKVCCPCGSPLPANYMRDMVQCKNPYCRALQHKSCVLGRGEVPPHFYCEICRINRADPFWVGRRNLLHPLIVDGTNSALKLDTEFEIQSEDLYLTMSKGYEIQVWCIRLKDTDQSRMSWPKFSKLEVNGIEARIVDGSGDQLLGPNDTLISAYLREGLNKLSLSGHEYGIFCLGVRLVKPRTIEEVCKMIPKEHEGEPLNDATERIIRCIRGGTETNGNADRDLEVLCDSATVDLRCPISGGRMKTAARFKSCVHMACFDLQSFLGLSQRTRKLKCPICLKTYSWEDIIIDPYFNRVINTIEHSGADTREIMIKSDGSWVADNRPNSTRRTNAGDSVEDPMIISDSE